MNKPDIRRALPQRRYKFGEFTVVVLGEIETGAAVNYRYIVAVVRDGDPEPGIYLCCEAGKQGAHHMRLMMRDGAEVIAEDPGFANVEIFTTAALDVLRQILNLGDEEAYRLV